MNFAVVLSKTLADLFPMLLFCVASWLVLSTSVVVSTDSVTSGASPAETVTSPPAGPGEATTAGAAGEVSVNGKDGTTTETPTLVEPLANLTVVNGSFAELSCVARTDGRNVVIVWLQSDEFKVLFYGSSRVTEDKRMSVRLLVEDGKTESTLRISPVLDVDEGKYICRLPRKEKIYTESMYLTVIPADPETNTTSVTEPTEDAATAAVSTSTSTSQTTSSQSSSSPPLPSPTPPPTPSASEPPTTIQSTTTATAQSLNGGGGGHDSTSTTNPDLTVTSR